MAMLAIISDSHNRDSYLELLGVQLERFAVDTILHLGDVTSPEMTDFLKGYKTYFVVGNNDFDRDRLEKSVKSIKGVLQEQPLCFDWNNRKIFAAHGHNNGEQLAQNAFDSGEWDLVCYGHTHRYTCESRETKGTANGVSWLLNPGALMDGSFCLINDTSFEPRHFELDDMDF